PPGANDTCLISNVPMFLYSELDPMYSSTLARVNSSTTVFYRCKQNFHRKPGHIAGCPRPGELQHSKVPDHAMGNNQSFPVATVFTYECKPGRQIIAGLNATSVTCWSNFTWSAVTEFCEALPGKNDTCSMSNLPTFLYSELDPIYSNLSDPINSSVIVVYRCKQNFHRNPYEDGSVTCVNGSWIHTNDSCSPGCNRPQELNYSSVPDHVMGNNQTFRIGTVLTYECKSGSKIIAGMNASSVTCSHNYTWSKAKEFCEGKKENCSMSNLPTFRYSELDPIYRNLTDPLPPTIFVVYRCKPDFLRNPYEDGKIACVNGSWVYANDSCSPGCQRPGDLKYAKVPEHVMGNKQTFHVGTVFQYVCNPGYQIIPGRTPAYAICVKNLTWLKAEEFCEGNGTDGFEFLLLQNK
ncbi:hypothetical protein lerEdw1_020700, partial [Lerista edwardsae]